MGAATDRYLTGTGHTRAEQDRFAARSHHLAAAAAEGGVFRNEIVPVDVHRRGKVTTVTEDEGIRADTTEQSLATLRPAFDSNGTITAGSSSQLSDGAAAVVLMSGVKARQMGVTGLGTLGGSAFVAGPDPSLLHQPARAIERAVDRDGRLAVGDLDLVEINEAFAGVALASIEQLGVDADIVNINGGAIALGHPVGMSGTRLLLTLALSLRNRGGGTGVAALCGGGGQGNALILRAL
jgi:acetyl-CoA C-acetyltransferase